MSMSSFSQGRRAADAELDLLAQTADGRVAAAKALLRGMQFGDSAFDRGYRSALIAAKNAAAPSVVAALVDPLAVFTPEPCANRIARRRAEAHSAGRILMATAAAHIQDEAASVARAVLTDHSRPGCCPPGESARATPVPAQPDASPTASPRGRGVGASGTSFTRN